MKKILHTILVLLISIFAVKAQDKIHKTDGQVLETKVLEITQTEIKYKVFANLNGPTYSLGKTDVIKVVYENGTTELFTNSENKVDANVKRAQNVYIEVLGQGLLFTANYDTRFGNKRNGLGGRIGVGGLSVDGITLTTIPASLNYLLGNGKSFFEIGLGATYIRASAKGNDSIFIEDGSESTVIGTMSFMYRLQPVNSGFSFRGGFTPFFSKDGFIPYYPGISLGYTF